MSDEVWVVSSGEYSDRDDVFACTTKEEADDIVRFLHENGLEVNEPQELPLRTTRPNISTLLRIEWYYDPETGEEWGPADHTWMQYAWEDEGSLV
jgi:hypothetical protein